MIWRIMDLVYAATLVTLFCLSLDDKIELKIYCKVGKPTHQLDQQVTLAIIFNT